MTFDFQSIDKRIDKITDLVSETSSDPGRHFDDLISECKKLSDEDKLHYILLSTHFDNTCSAKDFFQVCDWTNLNEFGDKKVFSISKSFFRRKRKIGGHRRHVRCMKWEKKGYYTAELLKSYRNVMEKNTSQNVFFNIGKKTKFEILYNRLKAIEHMHTRLPRFDHLERVTRVHSFYSVPERFYAENSTGPLDGLTLCILGQRYRKKRKEIKKYLLGSFYKDWNRVQEKTYHISSNPTFASVIQQMEKWLIDTVSEKISRRTPSFIFDLESCICNWQKRK